MDPIMLNLTQLSRSVGHEPRTTQAFDNPGVKPFEEMLTSSMRQVNRLQLESDDMIRRLAVGDVDDISEVVLASSRAEIASRMLMELRNQFVDAYQQLSRIQG